MIKKLRMFIIDLRLHQFDRTLEKITQITNGRIQLIRNSTPIAINSGHELAFNVIIGINGKFKSPMIEIPINEII